MSAFTVTKRTIDNVVMTMRPALMTGDDAANEFGRELWKMNIEAVSQRYDLKGTKEEADYLKAAEAYTFTEHKDTSDVQLFKSLGCFTYQCSEGDVPETFDLFKKCIKHEDTLQVAIRTQQCLAEDTPIRGYAEAKWDMA